MKTRKQQQGATAIEFALVLPVFIALIYAMVSYALIFMLTQSFTYASEDALRAALAVDCSGLTAQECVNDQITPAIRSQVVTTLSWLPDDIRNQVVGSSGEQVSVSCTGDTCTVEVRYDNYASNPMIPIISLPGIGNIPAVPQNLIGRASLRV